MTPFDVAGWRREVAAIYAAVRGSADPQEGWRGWCARRGELFRSHPASLIEPAQRAGFAGPAVFDYDPALRFAVGSVAVEGETVTFDLAGDGMLTAAPVARTAGLAEALGGELTLYWLEGYGGGLFLPFRDATSGQETYGGGRYLLDTIKGADLGTDAGGRLILDFNFAYFPSCAHNDAYVCPLPPAENRLPAAVRGGERWPD